MIGTKVDRRVPCALLALAVLGLSPLAAGALADKTKQDNSELLNLDSSWIGGAPTSGEWAVFGPLPVNHDFSLAADLAWGGLRVGATSANLLIGPGNALTLGNGGIDLSAATHGLTLDNNVTVAGSQAWNVATFLAVSGSVGIASSVLTIQGPGITTLNGKIAGSGGSVVMNGSGTLTLAGPNTFSGGFSLQSGTVNATSATALGNQIGTVTLGGGTLAVGADNLTFLNPMNVTGTTAVLAANTTALTGNFSGNGIVTCTVLGAGARLDLGSTGVASFADFSGTLALGNSTGQIRLQSNDINLGNAAVDLGSGSAFLNPRNDSTQAIGALSGGPNTALLGSSVGTAVTTWVIGALNTATTFSGLIGNGSAATPSKTNLTKIGTGTLTLARSNSTYSGTLAIQNGVLQVTTPGALGVGTSHIVLGTDTTSGTLRYAGTGSALTRLIDLNLGGTIDASGTGPLAVNSPGAITLGTLNQHRTLTLTGTNTGLNTLRTSLSDTGGVASKPVSLIKSGPGTWVLATNNTYSGGTTIQGGTLLATAGFGFPTGIGDITVESGSTFGGTSSIPGAVTVNGGGHLAPGTAGTNNGVGTLTFNNSTNALTMLANAFLDLDLQALPSAHDMLTITTGTLTLGDSINVNVYQAGTALPFADVGNYAIFSFAGTSNFVGSASSLHVVNNDPSAQKSYAFALVDSGSNGVSTLNLQITDVTPLFGHYWRGPTGSDRSWTTPANWIGAVPGAQPGDTATFGTASSLAGSVLLDGGRHIGTLEFDNATAYTLDPGSGGRLFLDNGTGNASVTLFTGSHAITAPVDLVSNTTISFTNSTNTLTISGLLTNGTANAPSTLTTLGPGKLILAASATYTGATTVGTGSEIQFGGGAAHSVGSITGGGAVTLNASTALLSDAVTVNALAINGAHTLRPGSSFSKVNTLAIGHTGAGIAAVYSGMLQLNDNRLILQTTDPADKASKLLALNEALFAGHNGTANTWSSTQGITSSTVAADPKLTIGVFDNAVLHRTNFAGGTNNVDDNSLLLSPALKGDANLDGIVNFNDMLVVTGNWNLSGQINGISTIDMAHGDLNGDGIVNFNDMLVVTGNWNNSSSQFNLSALLADPPTQTSELSTQNSPAPIPEPASLALLLVTAPWLLRRATRKR